MWLCALYGCPQVIQSDRGTHFTGQEVQCWAARMDIQWLFHTLYNPQAAGTIERCNSLLKQGLQVLRHPPMMYDWASHLWEVLRTLNEKPQRGGPSPVEALLHGTAAPVQLQVNTSEVLLKPAYVRSGNILLPAPTCLKAGEQQQWTWPWCLWVNTIMDWVHTYAGVANVFDCCVCTEFPVSTAVGLLWCIHPATAEDWTWLRGWNPCFVILRISRKWNHVAEGVKE
ncbi:uncharacterized protein RBU33_026815 [Hipposideros larvatus]